MQRSMRLAMRPLALLAAAWLLAGPAAHAQTPPSPPKAPAPGASTPSPNIPEQKLSAAAAALERVASLQQDYQERIAKASDSDKERLVDEGNSALVKAVGDQGLSVEEYNSILEVAQKDPTVRDKILKKLPSAK